MTKAAIYLRVSSQHQTTENQLPGIEQLARARGLTVTDAYEEQVSAVKHRPQYERMLRDAKRGRFRVLVLWSLDRFGRSLAGNVSDLLELDRLGVTVISVQESWLDSTGPTRGLLIAIMSWCAEQERTRLIERTKAGMERARRRGAKIGRPRREFDVLRAHELRAKGMSLRAVAAEVGEASTWAGELCWSCLLPLSNPC